MRLTIFFFVMFATIFLLLLSSEVQLTPSSFRDILHQQRHDMTSCCPTTVFSRDIREYGCNYKVFPLQIQFPGQNCLFHILFSSLRRCPTGVCSAPPYSLLLFMVLFQFYHFWGVHICSLPTTPVCNIIIFLVRKPLLFQSVLVRPYLLEKKSSPPPPTQTDSLPYIVKLLHLHVTLILYTSYYGCHIY